MTDPSELEGLRACVHCGLCLPACPTYGVLGEEMDSPRGRVYLMRAVAEGRAELTEGFARHFDRCLGCRACEPACPSLVPFGKLLEATRARLVDGGVRPRRASSALDMALSVLPYPDRLGPLLTALRAMQRTGVERLARRLRLTSLLGHGSAFESMIPEIPARTSLPTAVRARGTRRGVAGLHIGCVQRFLFPEVNQATATLLSHAGYDVIVPPQGCCGALHLHAGRTDEARALARGIAASFADADLIVSNAAGCGAAMKDLHHVVSTEEMRSISGRVRDVSEVLVEADLPLGPLDEIVAYHDACHLAHAQRVRDAPRALLRRVRGLELRELRDTGTCCGSAGLYSVLEPELARELVRRKVDAVLETKARILATGNPGCMMYIAQECRARGAEIEVVHPVTLLARALEAGSQAS